MSATETSPASDRELVLTRVIDASPEALFRCWSEPELMKQWFAPKPFETPRVELDFRPGGGSLIVMKAPDGAEYPNPGCYLEIIPNRKIVSTDAYGADWTPSAKPFMTLIITFEDLGNGQTKYVATARHWTVEDKDTHEKMGFHEGFGICADQLAALAATL